MSFDSYMLKEASDPTRQANQRARDRRDGPPLLAVDQRLVIPQGKVVKFIVTADDVIHSFAMPAFWIKQDANPGQLHETWAKVDRPGSISANARNFAALATASCRSPSRWFRRRSSRSGSGRTAAIRLASSPPAAAPRRDANADMRPGPPPPERPAQQPATNQAATHRIKREEFRQ